MTAELMARAQAGDIDAFGQLYARYRLPVLRLAFKYLPDQAEDITQDVFVKALAKLSTWQDVGKDPLAWLCTITVNLCRDRAMSAHQRHSFPVDAVGSFDQLVDDDRGPEQLAIDDLVRTEVLAALLTLSEEQRVAVVLYYFKGLRSKAIADQLGILEGTVRARLMRARANLAPVLTERGVAR